MSDLLDAALILAKKGKPVFPCHTPGKDGMCTCGSAPCKDAGKHPRTEHGKDDATTDEEQIRRWWGRWDNANIGVLTGWKTHCFVLDVDPRNGGFDSLNKLEKEHGKIPSTYTVKTGGGGLHLYFANFGKEKIENSSSKIAPGIDIKGEGGYVLAAPSLHASGSRYEVLQDVPMCDAPQWLMDLMGNGSSGPKATITVPEKIPQGAQETTLFKLACSNRRKGWSKDATTAAFREEVPKICEGFDGNWDAVTRAIESAYNPKYERGSILQEGDIPLFTDIANADRFAAQFKDAAVYCHRKKKWFVWNEKLWKGDESEEILQKGKLTVRRLYTELSGIVDDAARKLGNKLVIECESRAKLRNMIALAQPTMSISPEEFDADPNLFNCSNGTIELDTGVLRDHHIQDMISRISNVEFNKEATCMVWTSHLNTVFAGNQEHIKAFQRICGYSLTGKNREQVFFIPYGAGQNGKSVTFNALIPVFGDYAVSVAPATFMVRKNESGGETARPDILRLRGARVATAYETERRKELAESLIKMLTGDDDVTARDLWKGSEEVESFKASCKIFFITNYLPAIQGRGISIWRRIVLIPFKVKISDEQRDRDINEKLERERSGILKWCLEGLQEYQKIGLSIPKDWADEVQGYRADEDILSEWMKERCEDVPNCETPAYELYADYHKWAVMHDPPLSKKQILTDRKFWHVLGETYQRKHTKTGNVYSGLSLRGQSRLPNAEKTG